MYPLQKCIEIYKTDKIKLLSYFLISTHFLLNFLGTPLLKWFFGFELILILIACLIFPFKRLLLPIIGLFIIEGQGRILWEYHPILRNSFDIILLIALFKNLITDKKLLPTHRLPKQIIFLIILHFLWYLLQIFNLNNVGVLGVLAASKIYILPFLFFFLFLKLDNINKLIPSIQFFTIYITLLEVSLVIFQVFGREDLLLNISNYYSVVMKDIFIGDAFRPFGTSFVPGGISVVLFLMLPLQLMIKIQSKKVQLLQIITIVLSWVSLFFLQVRSATLKHFGVFILFNLFIYVASKNKIHYIAKAALMILGFSLLLLNINHFQKLFPEANLTYSSERFGTITYNIQNLKSKRITLDMAINQIATKIYNNPMGLGPGRTGAVVALTLKEIKKDPVYNINASWAFDNLFVSLAIDLGVGMLIYLAIIILLPLLIIFRFIRYFHYWNQEQQRMLSLICITLLILLIGNWGAIGIPYNPESFFFWFLIAIGLNQDVPIQKNTRLHL